MGGLGGGGSAKADTSFNIAASIAFMHINVCKGEHQTPG